MVLNNEVSILNIANIDNDIRDTYTRAMIAGDEKMEYASRNYDTNEYFIWNDRKLYKTKQPISAGVALIVDVNIKYVGTLAKELYDLYNEAPDNVRAYISNVEDTANASRAYTAGEYIIKDDGHLYRVRINVSLGTKWTVGSNIEVVDNVTSLINDLERKTDQTRSIIAYTEKTNIASKTYNTGDEFIFDNVKVKATTTIPKNSVITLNGNCTPSGNVLSTIDDSQVSYKTYQDFVDVGGSISLAEFLDSAALIITFRRYGYAVSFVAAQFGGQIEQGLYNIDTGIIVGAFGASRIVIKISNTGVLQLIETPHPVGIDVVSIGRKNQ